MEVDCNLKILANFFFFKFFLCILEKLIKIILIVVCSSFEKTLKINFPMLQDQFHVAKQVVCQIIEQL